MMPTWRRSAIPCSQEKGATSRLGNEAEVRVQQRRLPTVAAPAAGGHRRRRRQGHKPAPRTCLVAFGRWAAVTSASSLGAAAGASFAALWLWRLEQSLGT